MTTFVSVCPFCTAIGQRVTAESRSVACRCTESLCRPGAACLLAGLRLTEMTGVFRPTVYRVLAKRQPPASSNKGVCQDQVLWPVRRCPSTTS